MFAQNARKKIKKKLWLIQLTLMATDGQRAGVLIFVSIAGEMWVHRMIDCQCLARCTIILALLQCVQQLHIYLLHCNMHTLGIHRRL